MADDLPPAERAAFEEAVFAQYFLSAIKRTGLGGPLELQSTADKTKAEFVARDADGNYVETTLNPAWWAWQKRAGKEAVAAIPREPTPLLDFVHQFADEPCSYDDNCDTSVRLNHYVCHPCKARIALAAYDAALSAQINDAGGGRDTRLRSAAPASDDAQDAKRWRWWRENAARYSEPLFVYGTNERAEGFVRVTMVVSEMASVPAFHANPDAAIDAAMSAPSTTPSEADLDRACANATERMETIKRKRGAAPSEEP